MLNGRFARLCLLAALLAPCSASGQAQSESEAYFHYSMARLFDDGEEFAAAAREFQKALEADPNSPFLHVEFARSLWRSGDIRRAIEECEKALELDPANIDARLTLGRIYFNLRAQEPMKEKAAQRFGEILEIDPENVSALSSLGQLHFQNQEFDQAAEFFYRLRKASPDMLQAYYYEAQARSNVGQVEEAITALEEGLRIRSDIPEYLQLLGELYQQTGQTDKAEAVYEQGLARGGDPELLHRLASLFLDKGEVEKAIPLLDQVVAQQPLELQPRFDLAKALFDSRRYDDAIEHLDVVVERQPAHVGARYYLGLSQHSVGLRQEAIGHFEMLMETARSEQDRRAFRHHLAMLYQEVGRFDEGLALLREQVEAEPSVENRLRLFYGFRKAGEKQQALALTKALLAEEGQDPYVVIAHAQALAEMDRGEEAIDFLMQTGKNDSIEVDERPLLHLVASQIFLNEQRFVDAEELLRKAIEDFPEQDRRLRFQLGAVMERSKNYEAAEEIFRALLKEDPDQADVLNYLGYMLAEQDRELEEALALVQRAVELDPYNGAYLDSLGWAYFKLNRLEEAELYLTKAARINHDDAVILEHLGDLYRELGQAARARDYYEKSMSASDEEEEFERVERKLFELIESDLNH